MHSIPKLSIIVAMTFAVQPTLADNAENGPLGRGNSGTYEQVPDLDSMSLEERLDWLRRYGLEHGFSEAEMDQMIQESIPDRNLASRVPRQLDDGEDGANIGCFLNAILQPELGGCLERPFNRSMYDKSRALKGDGVLLPPDTSLIDPKGAFELIDIFLI